MAVAVFLSSFAAQAATVTGFSDLVTRLQVGVPADHEIKFVSPSGIGAPTDTVTLALQSDYDLTAVDFNDIDLGFDSDATPGDCAGTFTEKTLAATAGSSPVWGAAVSGQTLTLTPPTDAGVGEIPAGSCLRVRVGKNATFGAASPSANHQIVNPTGAFFHTLTIGGGFGDTGVAQLLNNDSDQVVVTASVGGGGGAGGGGGPVAPTIMNVRSLNVTETGADILWDTDVSSSSAVDHGTTTAYGTTATGASAFNHSVHLNGLTAGTTYHFRVRSTASGAPEAVSGDFTFTTPDTTAPVIGNIQAIDITGSGARITWDTDEDATSRVAYGLAEPFSLNSTGPGLTNAHDVVLSGLTPATTYYYRVTSVDAAGNSSTSVLFSFTTLDTIPPAISGIFVDAIGQDSARVNWVTDELATARIRYGLTTSYGSIVENANLVANHQGTLVGLAPGISYHFSVSSYDASGNGATSTDQVFTTLPDTTPPANVTDFAAASGDRQITLSWSNPTDADFSGVRIRRSVTGFPTTPSSGTAVYDGVGTSVVDTNLLNGTTYYYTAFAYDASGNFASGAVNSGTPQAPILPPPVCGDGVCTLPEDAASCPADCTPPGPICGNAVCENGETSASCPVDCPAVTPPIIIPPTTATAHLDPKLVRYFAIERLIRLEPDSGGFYRILPGRSLSVGIPEPALPQPAASITLTFNGNSYLFTPPSPGVVDPQYWSDVSAPLQTGLASGSITLTYKDGTSETLPFDVKVEPYGQVYAIRSGTRVPIDGAMILLQKELSPWVDWDGSPYRQANPVSTDTEGRYGYMAPTGRYRISVRKNGYRPVETPPIDLTTQVVAQDIELVEIPPAVTELIVPGVPITENIGNVARGLGAQGAYITKVVRNEVIENPTVKSAATQVVAPAAAVVSVTVLVTATQVGSLLDYLYFLVTQPILLLGRRRRKEFGVIYNALTKRPIDLAVIRLIRTSNGKLVRTLVTDRQGRYAFLVEPGEYRIEVSKPSYVFPTHVLRDRKEDARYLDLYHGEPLRVGEKGATITANIPIDPLDASKTARQLVWEEIGRRFQDVMSASSAVFTLVAALLYRQPYLYGLLAIQTALLFLFRRLARPPRPKSWGIVYDKRTKKPIPFAVARVVETRYSKVLESRVTDGAGRYNFLVGNEKYVVTVEKPGYMTMKTDEIDLTVAGKEGGGVVDKDIGLTEIEKKGSPSPESP